MGSDWCTNTEDTEEILIITVFDLRGAIKTI